MVLPTAGGCRSVLATVMWITRGNNVAAAFEGLEEKKVVVVCRPVADLTYGNSNVAKQLAKELSRRLEENVAKIEVVSPEKVAAWTDANMWDDYSEIGEALEADMVVGVDLQHFSIFQGQTLFQGKADVMLQVYDCTEDGQVVFEKELPQSVFPPNAVIPTSEKPEREFRRQYIGVLADQIGRHFYPHDAHADYALDVEALD